MNEVIEHNASDNKTETTCDMLDFTDEEDEEEEGMQLQIVLTGDGTLETHIKEKNFKKSPQDIKSEEIISDEYNGMEFEVVVTEIDSEVKEEENLEEIPSLKDNKSKTNVKRSYDCDECQKSFSLNGNLKRHKLTHIGMKLFTCITCEKTFSQKGDLNRHQSIHMNEKTFSCEICDRKFTQKRYLKEHMLHHTEENSFICSECGKSFTSKGNLKRHSQTHSGLKPYVCNICGRSYTQNGDLKKHKLNLHDYQCEFCSEVFSNQSEVTEHEAILHPNECFQDKDEDEDRLLVVEVVEMVEVLN